MPAPQPDPRERGPAGPPRTILYTGKGGVGKTSVAAATARRCASLGLRTVLVSTDPAHSLADSLETPLGGGEPVRVSELLWAQEVEAQLEMERNWAAVQEWLGRLLHGRGIVGVAAEELTVPPGMDELFSLLQVKRHHGSGEFDAVIVDCAPTGETLRLLSFPEIARWWLDKVLPWEGRLLAAARPFARGLDVPLPDQEVLGDVQQLVRKLIAMNEILRDRERTSIRLVMNPDRMVIREAQRTFTYLNLYGYLTDAVVVNRVFPDDVADGYFGAWRERQAENLELVREGFEPVPVLKARYFPEEVSGERMLDQLGEELWSDRDPAAVLHSELSQRLETEDGRTVLSIRVPFADREELTLKKVGSELVVRAGREKRTIILPSALSRHTPAGARLVEGSLRISFEPPPGARGRGSAAEPGEAAEAPDRAGRAGNGARGTRYTAVER